MELRSVYLFFFDSDSVKIYDLNTSTFKTLNFSAQSLDFNSSGNLVLLSSMTNVYELIIYDRNQDQVKLSKKLNGAEMARFIDNGQKILLHRRVWENSQDQIQNS